MLNTNLFLVLLFAFSSSAAQYYTVDYNCGGSLTGPQLQKATLYAKDNISIFEYIDTLEQEAKQETFQDRTFLYKKKEKNRQVVKDFSTDSLFFFWQVDYAQKFYLVADSLHAFNWALASATKTILGYECHSATTRFRGRTYTAWYTTEIPVPDGPWKLSGLPGLILEAASDDQAVFFNATKIQSSHTLLLPPRQNGIPTSFNNFLAIVHNDLKELSKYFDSKMSAAGEDVTVESHFSNEGPDYRVEL